MRFPKLMTTLFHRRTKSDPEPMLTRLISAPIANPQTRPISQTSIAQIPIQALQHSHSAADLLVPIAPLSPLELSIPFPSPGPRPIPSNSAKSVSLPASHRHADPPTQAPKPLAEAAPASGPVHHLKPTSPPRRKRDKQESDADVHIAALSAALKAECIAREVAEEACAEFALKVTALQDEVVQLRRTLFSSVTKSDRQAPSPSYATTLDSIMDASVAGDESFAVAENIALVVERDRLRRFVELMVSVGGHKPVVDTAYRRVTGEGENTAGGEDAEAALASAIKDAVRQPGSVWRELLEPVVGARTQAEYLAQVRCTLDARKQTRDWRKRATFWKGRAKEDGRNADTITPSSSALSEVADGPPVEGKKTTRVVVEGRGLAKPHVNGVTTPQGEFDDGLSPTASRFALDMVAHWNADGFGPALELTLPAASSSMVLPAIGTTSTFKSPEKPLPGTMSRRDSHSTAFSARGSPSQQMSPKFRRWDLAMRSSTESARSSGTHSTANEAVQASALSEGSTAVASPLGSVEFSMLPDFKESVVFGDELDPDLVLVLHKELPDLPGDSAARAPSVDGESERGSESGASSSASSPKKSRLPVRMRGLRVIKRLSTTFSISRGIAPEMGQTDARAN